MHDKNTTLSRSELLELVWTMPTNRIAAEYAVPITAVLAACTHLNIPRPRAGHWSAVKFGTAPSRPPLPPNAAGQPQATTLGEWGRRYQKRAARTTGSSTPAAAESPVVEKSAQHPLALKTLAAYRGASTDRKTGLLIVKPGKTRLRLAVRPESLERAIGLLSRLFTRLEQKGFIFVSDPKTPDQITTVFSATKTPVDWFIQELQERYQRELKPEEKDDPWIWDRWRYRSLGRLRLAFTGYHPIKGGAQSWSDGKNQKLDGKLDEIAEAFVVFAHAQHAWACEIQERDKRWAEEHRIREEHEAWKAEEEKRRSLFKDAATKWRAAQEVRAFRAACERSLRSKLPSGSDLSRTDSEWLKWADEVVNTMDPLHGDFLVNSISAGRLRELNPAQLRSLRSSAQTMGVPFEDIVSWLYKAREPDAAIDELVERIVTITGAKLPGETNYYTWLRRANASLDGRTPLEYFAHGHIRELAEYVATVSESPQ